MGLGTEFVIGQTVRTPHTNFLPGSTENFWFRSVNAGAITAVMMDLSSVPTGFVMPRVYVQEYHRKDRARGFRSVVEEDATGSLTTAGVLHLDWPFMWFNHACARVHYSCVLNPFYNVMTLVQMCRHAAPVDTAPNV